MTLHTEQSASLRTPVWIERHRGAWARKRLLRSFYTEEYFDRIVRAMRAGRSMELGAGPGFFAQHHRCDVVTDVALAPHIDQVVDVHDMPFDDESFDSIVGIDVVHHFFHPARGLSEIARVLRPHGRLVLVEPWTGPVGHFVNKYLHTEECSPLANPWGAAFSEAKDALEGNATIPKAIFFDHAEQLFENTGLRVVELVPFSCLGFLATGGFTRWGAPYTVGRAIMNFERRLSARALRRLAIKVFVVTQKGG